MYYDIATTKCLKWFFKYIFSLKLFLKYFINVNELNWKSSYSVSRPPKTMLPLRTSSCHISIEKFDVVNSWVSESVKRPLSVSPRISNNIDTHSSSALLRENLEIGKRKMIISEAF